MAETVRIESDSMGQVAVPADRYYGAQTQRSRDNFRIGGERFTREVIAALGVVKKAAALANRELGRLDDQVAELIVRAADEVLLHPDRPEELNDKVAAIAVLRPQNGVLTVRAAEERPARIAVPPGGHIPHALPGKPVGGAGGEGVVVEVVGGDRDQVDGLRRRIEQRDMEARQRLGIDAGEHFTSPL